MGGIYKFTALKTALFTSFCSRTVIFRKYEIHQCILLQKYQKYIITLKNELEVILITICKAF